MILVTRTAMALFLGAACLLSAPARAQDCLLPEEAEAFAIVSLRSRMMVGDLQCRTVSGYNQFVSRFGTQLLRADARLDEFGRRAAPQAARQGINRLHANLANAWAQDAMVSAGRGRDFCAEAAAAFTEAMALGEAEDLAPTAVRLTEPMRGQMPPACAAATPRPAD